MERTTFLAWEGIKTIDCVKWQSTSADGKVATLLNAAWKHFWTNPKTYPIWERTVVERIM